MHLRACPAVCGGSFAAASAPSGPGPRTRKLFQVLFQVSLELLHRHVVDARRSLVGLDSCQGWPQIRQGIDLVHPAVPLASQHSLFESCQHPFRPDRCFNPGPSSPNLSGGLSPCGHGVRYWLGLPSRLHLPALPSLQARYGPSSLSGRRRRAGHRPPPKLHVRFSRMQLSRRHPLRRREQRARAKWTHFASVRLSRAASILGP